MMPSASEWHERFIHQARWTAEIRHYLTADLQITPPARLLEIGCGTGALFSPVNDIFPSSHLHGLDILWEFLDLADSHAAALCQGDAFALPYRAAAFDLVYCHFLFLWLSDPESALSEMVRVLKPGGFVLAFAEPDYGGRIDFPPEMSELGRLQTEALSSQGADTEMGRKLAALFSHAGLMDRQVGILGGNWALTPGSKADQTEHWALAHDLRDRLSAEAFEQYLALDRQARSQGKRILFVPTFYARGRKPDQPLLHE